jgi:hypothetical protein
MRNISWAVHRGTVTVSDSIELGDANRFLRTGQGRSSLDRDSSRPSSHRSIRASRRNNECSAGGSRHALCKAGLADGGG